MGYSFKKALQILTKYATEEGYSVTFDYKDISQINWISKSLNTPKVIKIQDKYNNEIKTYILLHELGHHELRKDWAKFESVLPVLAHAEAIHHYTKDGRLKRQVSYIVSSLEEEFKAWSESKILASKLEIKIDEIKWNKFKTKCLMEYIRYYGAPKK